jgi:lysophospholipase L1-like esterase
MNKTTFRISILLNLILIVFILSGIYRLREHLYQKWILHKGKATLVMFGDSHTVHGKWNFLIKNQTVLRLGYSGFGSEELSRLIPLSFYYQPKMVFIQCGGNDIGDRHFSLPNTLNNFKFMADTLRSKNIQPVFQKALYMHGNPRYNMIIDSLNRHLEIYCKKQNIDLINIGENMYDSTGLKASLTIDNVHLNKEGYKLWAAAINDYLEGN